MHSVGKPLEERISAKCWALQNKEKKNKKVYNFQLLPHAYSLFLFFKIPWIKLLPAVQIRKHQGLIKWDSTKKLL